MSIALKYSYWYKPMSCSVTPQKPVYTFHGRNDQFFFSADVATGERYPDKILSSSNTAKMKEYICTILKKHPQLYFLLNNFTVHPTNDYMMDTTFLNHGK